MQIIFQVEGMHCEGCATRVRKIVEAKAPGTLARVDLAAGRVTVEGQDIPATIATIISDAGYPARPAS